MADTVRTVGPPQAPKDRGSPPTAWFQIDWTTVERRVQNLRFRIFRAAKEQCWKQVRHLTKLLLRSIGLSGMRGNSHVPFLGEEAMVTPPPYPTVRSFLASAAGSG